MTENKSTGNQCRSVVILTENIHLLQQIHTKAIVLIASHTSNQISI